ncbi:hypothetical protein [Pseudomonas rubra]|uniref:Uncharacterized protein n=1 Tax=Pseudomonas rubra TaxID=2942627 RepID=A0ABT5PDW4_9PSED|nr:hypothetical protein [Pseudomonas rubra]MDD1016500.1 hypothetical protein [Pseudomonas rubra]MDD1038502.1 hypothetical protein [Pseudomonas rubra]MDD1157812.1 hypothetical protein [Pseudomonas rubra]
MNHQAEINACLRRNFPLLTLSWLLAVASLISLMLVINGTNSPSAMSSSDILSSVKSGVVIPTMLHLLLVWGSTRLIWWLVTLLVCCLLVTVGLYTQRPPGLIYYLALFCPLVGLLVLNGRGYRRMYARFVEISNAPRAKRLPGEPVDVLRYPGMAAFLRRYMGRFCAAFFLAMASIALATVQVEYAYFAQHLENMGYVLIVILLGAAVCSVGAGLIASGFAWGVWCLVAVAATSLLMAIASLGAGINLLFSVSSVALPSVVLVLLNSHHHRQFCKRLAVVRRLRLRKAGR